MNKVGNIADRQAGWWVEHWTRGLARCTLNDTRASNKCGHDWQQTNTMKSSNNQTKRRTVNTFGRFWKLKKKKQMREQNKETSTNKCYDGFFVHFCCLKKIWKKRKQIQWLMLSASSLCEKVKHCFTVAGNSTSSWTKRGDSHLSLRFQTNADWFRLVKTYFVFHTWIKQSPW